MKGEIYENISFQVYEIMQLMFLLNDYFEYSNNTSDYLKNTVLSRVLANKTENLNNYLIDIYEKVIV